MFKFSFPNPNDESDRDDEGGVSKKIDTDLLWLPSEKVEVSESHLKYMLVHQESVNHMIISNLSLAYVSTDSAVRSVVEKSEDESCVKLAEELHSDLVPSKYEGGLKIWECTEDLLQWLLSINANGSLKGKHVLDLGCGTGLLGIAALKYEANVVFQDYNKEVLESSTIPNVLLNLSDQDSGNLIHKKAETDPKCEFYCGDWSSFPDKLQEGREEQLKFDVILTSETIYNPQNYLKLCNVFQKCLKTSGCVFLAAKTCYFGVGGSLREFENCLQKMGTLKSEVCWRCPSGVSREILKITFSS